MRKAASLFALVLVSAGCFHATIETGRPASSTVSDKGWAHGFLWGLVPPSTVETAQKCPSGVAKVETQQSFLNLLANLITSGLYSPMQITVTCASGGTADSRTIRAKNGAEREALVDAASIALNRGTPVFVALR